MITEKYELQEVLEGIGSYLKENFPDFHIYDHDPRQDLKLPCFIVKPVNESYKKRIGLKRSMGEMGTDNVMFQITTIVEDYEYTKLRHITQQIRIGLSVIHTENGGYRTYAMNDNYSEFNSVLLFRIKVQTLQRSDQEVSKMKHLDLDEYMGSSKVMVCTPRKSHNKNCLCKNNKKGDKEL